MDVRRLLKKIQRQVYCQRIKGKKRMYHSLENKTTQNHQKYLLLMMPKHHLITTMTWEKANSESLLIKISQRAQKEDSQLRIRVILEKSGHSVKITSRDCREVTDIHSKESLRNSSSQSRRSKRNDKQA